MADVSQWIPSASVIYGSDNMADLVALRAELDAGHPDTGAYNIDDAIAADELNLLNRPGPAAVEGMLNYLFENRSRTNSGTDTARTSMLGRLVAMSQTSPPDDPFGSGTNATQAHVHAAKMFVNLLHVTELTGINFENTEFQMMIDLLGSGAGNGKVWKQADSNVLKGLSAGLRSRVTELKLGRVRTNEVTKARAL
jgi:hypothetical protein